MQVLIVAPTIGYAKDTFGFATSGDFPTGLAYIASALKTANHDVDGLNPNNDVTYISPKEMLKAKLSIQLHKKFYDIVAFGGLCIHYQFMKDSIELTRRESPDSTIICGGQMFTDDAEFAMESLSPDFCVLGQGEETIVDLLKVLENGGDLNDVCNIGYKQDNKIVFTRTNFKYQNINARAFPDYSLFDMDEMLDLGGLQEKQVFRYTRKNPRVMPIITALGCPFSCTFCIHDVMLRYYERDLPSIMEEIRLNYERYNFNILLILDELFAVKKGRLENFCKELIKNKEKFGWDFDWTFQTHAKAGLTRENLKLLKQAGCTHFSYGIESASEVVLQSMKKKSHPSMIEEAINLSLEAEIGFGGNFIFGDVAESIDTVFESMNFFKNKCMDIHINLGMIHPYPGSGVFDVYSKQNNLSYEGKEEFYKNIDAVYINQSTVDDKIWAFFSQKIFELNLHRWEKLTSATQLTIEKFSNDTLWAERMGQKICRISAACPHCDQNINFREAIKLQDKAALLSEAKTRRTIYKEFDLSNLELNQLAIISRVEKFFEELVPDKNNRWKMDFITACCPKCYKKLTIDISQHSHKLLDMVDKKRKMDAVTKEDVVV